MRTALLAMALLPAFASLAPPTPSYSISPAKMTHLWIDSVNGKDENSGATEQTPVRSYSALKRLVPEGTVLREAGLHVHFMPGEYPRLSLSRIKGSRNGPLILEAARGQGTVFINAALFSFCESLYIVGLGFRSEGKQNGREIGSVLHIQGSQEILVRNAAVQGLGNRATQAAPKEGLKVNQSRFVYVEDSEFSNAWDNAIDIVAVQSGHFARNRIHDSGSFAMYVKGGSARLRIEANELYNSAYGFSAGLSTGTEFLVAPWMTYEAENIRFVNNWLHDLQGTALTVAGGKNILFAHNTMSRVSRAAMFSARLGERTCDGSESACREIIANGGWGASAIGKKVPVPNRNVFIYNNLLVNPAGYRLARFLQVRAPQAAPENSGLVGRVYPDRNLHVRGNLIFQAGTTTPLGVSSSDEGCGLSNRQCNLDQLVAENSLDEIRVELKWAPGGALRPESATPEFLQSGFSIPSFPADDERQVSPASLQNQVLKDASGQERGPVPVPGAWLPLSGKLPRK